MRILVYLFSIFISCTVSAGAMVDFAGELTVAEPTAIAVHQDGTLYVARHDGTIAILNPAGETINTIGGKARAWKTILENPAGLALYNDNLYVADTGLDRISVFNKTGEFLEGYGSGGGGPKEFKNPQSVFVYRGVIYVADTGNDRIQVLGENGVFLQEIGVGADGDDGQLDSPMAVAVDRRGRIYAIDRDGRIKVYAADGTYMRQMPEISNAGAICLSQDGMYVSDNEKMCVKKLSNAFVPVLRFGTKGEGRAQFQAISSLAAGPDGRIFVADPDRNRIQVFTPEAGQNPVSSVYAPPPTSVRRVDMLESDGERYMTRIVTANGALYAIDEKTGAICRLKDGTWDSEVVVDNVSPEALAFDRHGGMYLLEAQTFYKIDENGTVAYRIEVADGGGLSSRPDDMVIVEDGTVYVTDRRHHKINVLNTDGIFIRSLENHDDKELSLADPIAVDVDAGGRLYVLDADAQMVTIFSTTGESVKSFSVAHAGGEPVDLAVAGTSVYVLDQKQSRVRLYADNGEYIAGFGSPGPGPGDMVAPVSIATLDKVRFVVAEPEKERLQIFAVVYTPEAPQKVVATGRPRAVGIEWVCSPGAFVEDYLVYRAEAGTPAMIVGRTDRCRFEDTDVLPGVAYDYRVAAVAQQGNASALSAISSAIPQKLTAPPPQNLSVTPKDFSVTLSWDPTANEDNLARYVIYRDDVEIARVTASSYVDRDVRPQTDYVYKVASLSRDGVLSDAVTLTTRTQVTTRPPVDIEVVALRDIFSNTYKNYEKNGIGSIRVRNNTNELISKLTIQFTIKNFMDFASETVLRDMAPAESREITLKAVFNDRILNVTEDTPVQTEITAAYYMGGEQRVYAAKQSINVYEKHKMTWDDPARIAAFVTTKDGVVMDFARGVLTQYDYTTDPLVSGCLLFNAIGTAGVIYTRDPSNSYQETKDNTDLIDYLQYPRETLRRKSGDCDDLAILYAALLESVGIKTRFVEGPGHIFLMFQIDTAIMSEADTMNDMLAVVDGQIWVPVEVTHVGKAFVDAWDAGSRQYSQWAEAGVLSTLDVHHAWRAYKPASLPLTDFVPAPVTRADMEQRFPEAFDVIRNLTIKIKHRQMVASLAAEPENTTALLQLGIIYAQYGILDQAMTLFERALENEPDNAALLNNMGNLYFLEGHYQKAVDAYRKAVEADPDDAFVWVNLAKALLKIKATAEAKQTFDKACTINPEVIRNHRSLALKLLGPS
ncbi:MAG: tetratricopeptide repeat protein [Thermodesulfobacteriota bacterium]|nr:tetratricopeptide repeat protein [Thermodesulfobacteriota bacterium]